MSVYLIDAVGSDRVKIGYASNLNRRVRTLATASPFPLVVLATRDGGITLESAMHRSAPTERLNGEWFAKWEGAADWFQHFEPSAQSVLSADGTETNKSFIDDLGGNAELAKALRLTPNAISNWRARGIPWKMRPVVARMATERGIALPSDFWGEAA